MKEGMTISGLSTAASIWLCSAIGVLVGVGFYAAAISLTALAILSMLIIARLENQLPQKRVLSVIVKFKEGVYPSEDNLLDKVKKMGYALATNSLSIETVDGKQEWQCMIFAKPKQSFASLTEIANELSKNSDIESFKLMPVRN